MQMIRVLIVDDHPIVRDGIRGLLGLAGDIEVVGEASNGREAIEKVGELAPDVVLMDLAMPVMGGLEATRRIHRDYPRTKVVVLTQYDDRERVFLTIEAGACGFITKTASSSELTAATRAAYRGESFLSPAVASILVDEYQRGAKLRDRGDPYERLTDRERDVLKLVAEGYTTQQIAEMLVISPKTVERHKTSLMAKIDIHNRFDLVKYALRKGIISSS